MAIFLDTGTLGEIERFHRMGVLRGVTTNPTILFKEGVSGGMKGLEARARHIAKLIAPYPLSVEVTTTEREAGASGGAGATTSSSGSGSTAPTASSRTWRSSTSWRPATTSA